MTTHATISKFTDGAEYDQAAFNAGLIDEFVRTIEAAPRTKTKYRFHLTELDAWLAHPRTLRAGRSTSLLDLTPGDVQRFMGYLKSGERYAATERCRIGELSASARKSFHGSMRSFYRYLVSVEMVTVDPTASVGPPKVTARPGLRLTLDELMRLLDAPGEPRDRIQTFLLAFTGARMNEIRSLRWQCVDFVEQTIMLHGKGDTYRALDIHPRLMGELRRWYIYQQDLAAKNPAIAQAKSSPDTDYVLLSRNGRPLADTTIMKTLKARAARAGLYSTPDKGPDNPSALHPHALRRTVATLLLNDGHHLDAVADVLGHKSVDTTRTHYAFASNARRKATIHALRA